MILTQHIDRYCTTRQQQEGLARDNSKFRVSDSGKCRLMRYWKRQGKPYEPSDIPISVLRQMQMGVMIHTWVENMIAVSAGDGLVAFQSEGTVEDEHRLGHYDLLLSMIDSTQILYDVKTVNSKRMYYIKDKGNVPKNHIWQVCTYASMLPMLPEKVILAYINRDTMDILESAVRYKDFVPSVTDDWQILVSAWEQQQEPHPNPEASWECRYCIYQHNCPHA